MTPRRSAWRMRADDPKTPFGWWWRGVVLEARLAQFAEIVFCLSVPLLFLFKTATVPLVAFVVSALIIAVYKRVAVPGRLVKARCQEALRPPKAGTSDYTLRVPMGGRGWLLLAMFTCVRLPSDSSCCDEMRSDIPGTRSV